MWNRQSLYRLPSLLALTLAVLPLVGCGRPSGSVTGKVTLKGQALTAGNVSFIGADDNAASSPIGPDGSYTIEKVAAGPAKICITPPVAATGMPKGMNMDPGKMDAPSAQPASASPATAKPVSIPEKYQNVSKSGLTYTVKTGPQEYNIDLK